MNFSPLVRSWLLLIFIVLGTGISAGTTALLGGADPVIAFLIGLGTGSSNVVMNLMKSPADRASEATENNPPKVP